MGRIRTGAVVGLAAASLWLAAACADDRQDSDRPPAEPPVYAEQARALLGGLAAGDELAGWNVESVAGPVDGRIEIRVTRGDEAFTAWLVKKGAQDEPPPYSTELVDVYFGYSVPTDPGPEGEQIHAVLNEVVGRVTSAEAEVTLPPGM